MEEEKYSLLMLSSQSSEAQLARLISYTFSNEHLYVNGTFRRLVESDRKGYVPAQELLKHNAAQEYFDELQIYSPAQQLLFLKATIRAFCPELHFSEDRVRRLDPWQRDTVKLMKPVCLSSIREAFTVSDIRDYFGDECFTTATQILPNKPDQSILVYTKNPSQWAETFQARVNVPFDVIDYAQLCRDRARDSRIFDNGIQRTYKPLQYLKDDIPHEDPSRRQNNHPRMRCLETARRRYYQDMPFPEEFERYSRTRWRESYVDEATFNELVRNPNPNFNQMLKGFIESGQQATEGVSSC